MTINGLILAAGNSSRLGLNKQTIQFNQWSLLQLIENNLQNCCDQVTVVLGHEHQKMTTQPLSQVVINTQWQSGIGSSLKTGIQSIKHQSDAVLIALCDQPLIPQSHYQQMVKLSTESPQYIITSMYQNIQGVPAIFPSAYFNQLLTLDDHQGAQKIITTNAANTLSVACPSASHDIDTKEDLTKLLNLNTGSNNSC